jgi:hypothetical protein
VFSILSCPEETANQSLKEYSDNMKLANIIHYATIALPLILAGSNTAPAFVLAIVASTNTDITTSLRDPDPQKVCLNDDRKSVKYECEGLDMYQNLGNVQFGEPSKEPAQVEINWPGNTRYVSTPHSMQGQN